MSENAATAIKEALIKGAREVVVRERPDTPNVEQALSGLVLLGLRVLVVAEFDRVKPIVAQLRKAGGDAGLFGFKGRIEVGNYEKVGLYLRMTSPGSFSHVVFCPHAPQNTRSAQAIRDHFAEAFKIEIAIGRPCIEGGSVLVRTADGRIAFDPPVPGVQDV